MRQYHGPQIIPQQTTKNPQSTRISRRLALAIRILVFWIVMLVNGEDKTLLSLCWPNIRINDGLVGGEQDLVVAVLGFEIEFENRGEVAIFIYSLLASW